MPDKKKIYVHAGIDVEEEGLFCGRYQCRDMQVTNTACLEKLAPLLDKGLAPTLFCAWSALADAPSRRVLDSLRKSWPIEIGFHLHHWNTPPFKDENAPPVLLKAPASAVPLKLMAAKLRNLFQLGQDFNGAPVASFRMGRWDLHKQHWPLLFQLGVLCDASIRPMNAGRNPESGPDHYAALTDPYRIGWNGKEIFEIPCTVAPIAKFSRRLADKSGLLRSTYAHWGCLELLPIEHPLWVMKLVSKMHISRGGKALSLSWHSSEMMAKGSPRMKNEDAVNRLLHKISAWMDWLESRYDVRYATSSQLRLELSAASPGIDAGAGGDWFA